MKQKIPGFWELEKKLAELLLLSCEGVLNNCPSEFKEKNHFWVTMIVIKYLRLNFSAKLGSLTLILEKAEEYLIENGVEISKYQEGVEALFEKNK